MSAFIRVLDDARRRRGLTRNALARRANQDRANLGHILAGRQNTPSLRIAYEYGMAIDGLTYEERLAILKWAFLDRLGDQVDIYALLAVAMADKTDAPFRKLQREIKARPELDHLADLTIDQLREIIMLYVFDPAYSDERHRLASLFQDRIDDAIRTFYESTVAEDARDHVGVNGSGA